MTFAIGGDPTPAPPRPDGPLAPLPFLRAVWRNPISTWSRQSFEIPFIEQNSSIMGRIAIVHEPSAIRRVFVENAGNYQKDKLQLRVLNGGLRQGLLTSEGETWRAQRPRARSRLHAARGRFLPARDGALGRVAASALGAVARRTPA